MQNKSNARPRRRSYHQYCGIAKALDLVGERWTLLLVRNLLLGPQRYSELLHALPGITTNLLAKRLQEMEGLGLVERIPGAPSAGGHAWRLTPRGLALEPALRALASWGAELLRGPRRGDYVDVAGFLLALRWAYRGSAPLRAEVLADGVPYRVTLGSGAAAISRGEMPSPDVRIRGSGAAITRLFLEPRSRRARGPDAVAVEGPSAALRVLLDAFALEGPAVGRAGATAE